MPADVFLSYARRASALDVRPAAAALKKAGVDAFFDERDVPAGDRISAHVEEALLAARLVVVFAEPAYFARWYCRLEYDVACVPFRRLVDRDAPDDERTAALQHLVVALPSSGTTEGDLDVVPPAVRDRNWVRADDTAALVALVRRQLDAQRRPLGDLLRETLGETGVDALFARAAAPLPQPLRLAAVPGAPPLPVCVPPALRGTLRDRFVGRGDDLWRLHDALAPASTTTGRAALTGTVRGVGGVGKTQLAAEYLYRYGPRHYTGGVFWIDAKGDAVEQHHAILSELDEATPPLRALREHAGDERVATELRRRLADTFREAPVERPMLLVVDDVPEPAAGEPPPPLETWCPAPDAVACLTTSRAAVRFEGGTDLTQITLPVLDPEPAVDVLTGGDVDRAALAHDEWLRIARWVGHLPLALTLLNSAMSGEFEPLPPRDVLGAADAGRSPTKELDRAMDALRDVVPKGALRGVSEAFTLSYELLPEDARVAARTLAELAPEPIPRQLLDALGGPCADARVQALVRARSFVLPARAEKGSPTVPMFGVMHAVLADFLRSRPDETASGAYASAARRALLSVMTSERCLDPTSWPLLRTCLPHAEWLIAAGQAGGGVRDESDAEQPVALWMRVGLFLWARGDLAGGRRAEEAGARLAERRLGPDHDVTLSILANLGVSLLALGDLAASRALHERVLAARMRRLGPEHHDTLVSTNYLAYVLLGQGDAAGARVLSERAVAVQRRTLGEEHSDTLESMTYLANSLAVLGDLAEARALLTRVVEARTRQLGAEHRETLTSMNDLADVLLRQGDAAGARPLAERVLSGYTRLLGDEHPYTLTSMDNLASILRALGDAARALPLQERVVEARRHLLGAEHPHTLTSMHNLGSTLRDLGRAADARRVFEETLRVRRRVLGDAHPSTHNTRRTLRALLEELGDTDAARALDAS